MLREKRVHFGTAALSAGILETPRRMTHGTCLKTRTFGTALLAAMVSQLHAATITWKTGADGSYAIATNWNGNGLPLPTDVAQMGNGGFSRIGPSVTATAATVQSSHGTFSIEGGTLTAANLKATGAAGVIESSSGTLTVTTDARIEASGGRMNFGGSNHVNLAKVVIGSTTTASDTRITVSGDAVVTQNQNTGGGANRELWIGGNNGGSGDLVLSGNASWTQLQSNTSTETIVGSRGGTGFFTITDQASFTQSGAAVKFHLGSNGWAGLGGGSGTLNLNGGTLTVNSIQRGGGNGTVNANGGTLKALSSTSAFFVNFTGSGGTNSVNLLGGGLKFDTNGKTVTLGTRFSGSGGLTKLGAGSLTLDASNAYGGATVVSQGMLRLNTASLDDYGAVTIAAGASLNLPHGEEDRVGSLTIGSTVATAGSTWGSSASGAEHVSNTFFSGTGRLRVGNPAPPEVLTGGLDAPQAVAPFFNGAFQATAPGQPTAWEAADAFPNLSFIDPMWLAEIPGTSDFLLVCKNGQMWRFPNHPAVTQSEVVPALDVSARTMATEDQGFYSLAFHPEFGNPSSPNKNYAYVCYSCRPTIPPQFTQPSGNRTYWRVSRFTWQPATGSFDPASEFVLIDQFDPQLWHNGGATFFGSDGFLYVTAGDGGDSDDSFGNAQKIDVGFFSGMLRIDVDNNPAKSHAIRRQPADHSSKPTGWPASHTQGYGIPNDNPWLDAGGAILEEYFAIGMRSPHTAHQDAETGEIWVGDVGQGTREELDLVTKGANCQWSYREGSVNGPKAKPATLTGFDSPPVYDYGRSTGGCIIGGMRYRGSKWASELGGKILFGDNSRGKVWTASLMPSGPPLIEEIVSNFRVGSKTGLANFCTDSAGEIYMMDLNGTNKTGGKIRKLAPQAASVEPPQFLSETGVFTDLATLATAPGVIPYDVASPLWSDGAEKKRWIILPNDGAHDAAAEKIAFSETDNWVFPAGTVFVKHFEMPYDERNPALVRRLETRFIVCTTGGGKYGVTYKWNAAGTDAELLTNSASEDYEVTLADGSSVPRQWYYPSRADCILCHNQTAGQALGVRTHQLNKNFHYAATGRTANQLTTFQALGMFDTSITASQILGFLQSRNINDETAPVEHRVRSYLASNCSHCHQPGGTIEYFDARLQTPLDEQGLMDVVLKGEFNLGPEGRYLKPGDAEHSALYVRMSNAGNPAAMPPLAKNVVDQKAATLLHDYLLSLTPGEFQPAGSRPARCEIAGPSGVVSGAFDVTVVFDMNVSGFTASDLAVSGGEVKDLRGNGYYYVGTIQPTGPVVGVSVLPNAVNPQGAGSRASNTVSVFHPADYLEWAALYGLDGSEASQAADGDHDGLANLVEYAFNLNPTTADVCTFDPATSSGKGLPRLVMPSPPSWKLSLQFLRRKNAAPLSYQAEFGAGLGDFAPSAAVPSVESIDANWEKVTVEDASATGSEPKRFGRVKLEWAEP